MKMTKNLKFKCRAGNVSINNIGVSVYYYHNNMLLMVIEEGGRVLDYTTISEEDYDNLASNVYDDTTRYYAARRYVEDTAF